MGALLPLSIVILAWAAPPNRGQVPSLVKQLSSPSPQVRAMAAEAIGRLGDAGKPASRALCTALADPSPLVRSRAAHALEEVNPELFKRVKQLLGDGDLADRMEAVVEIGKMGSEGNPAIPLLVEFRGQLQASVAKGQLRTNPEVHLIATAIGQAGKEDPQAALILEHWLATDPDAALRGAAARAIPRMKDGPKAVRALLTAARTDPNGAVRVSAITSLGELGPAAKSSQRFLEQAARDSSPQVRDAAAKALVKIRNGK
jgi:HEAT repeat protein